VIRRVVVESSRRVVLSLCHVIASSLFRCVVSSFRCVVSVFRRHHVGTYIFCTSSSSTCQVVHVNVILVLPYVVHQIKSSFLPSLVLL
jgi:hypothetical protein